MTIGVTQEQYDYAISQIEKGVKNGELTREQGRRLILQTRESYRGQKALKELIKTDKRLQ